MSDTVYPKRKNLEPRDKGTWFPLNTDKGPSATFVCPKCGTNGTLDGHGINKHGVVWPSVMCPNDCSFHETIILGGWGHE